MTDIIERLRIESRREPHEPIWRDAIDEIEALRAEVDALAKDAAKYRWALNNSRWIRGEREAYVAIPVAPDADLSCVAMRDAAIDDAMEKENSND